MEALKEKRKKWARFYLQNKLYISPSLGFLWMYRDQNIIKDDLPPLNRSRYNVVSGLNPRKGRIYGKEALHT
jgi:hypothetical protein